MVFAHLSKKEDRIMTANDLWSFQYIQNNWTNRTIKRYLYIATQHTIRRISGYLLVSFPDLVPKCGPSAGLDSLSFPDLVRLSHTPSINGKGSMIDHKPANITAYDVLFRRAILAM